LSEFFQAVSNVERRPLRSAATLLLCPGQITADYLALRRARYLPPFRLYLLLNLALYFALGVFSGTSTVSLNVDIDVLDSVVATDAVMELPASVIPQIGFALLPIAAMILKLLYRRRGMPFGDHFVAVLHIMSAAALILCLAALLQGLLGGVRVLTSGSIPQMGNMLLLLAALICFVHLGFSLQRIYAGRWTITVVRTGLLLAIYCACVLVLVLSVVVALAGTMSSL